MWALLAAARLLAGSWLKAASAFARRHPVEALLIASLAGNVWLWRSKAACEDAARAIPAATARATAAQAAVNHEPARVSGAIARESNATAPAYYAGVRRAAAAHAVRVPRPARPVGPADLPGTDPVEPGVHGPDAAADLVCRPAADDGQILDAAARGAKMRQEGLDLIAAGAAVAETDQ